MRSCCSILSLATAIGLAAAQYDTPLNTTRQTVGWVYGPNYRSTSDIVFSCVLTMGLCVWSALHLNIPLPTETRARKWFRNAGWVGLGIFGPELVMFAAWKQWVSARALQNMMSNRTQCSTCPPDTIKPTISLSQCSCTERKTSLSSDPTEWTITHGYYATMGGFVFDIDSGGATAILNKTMNDTRMTITPQGLQLLAECGLIPEIETREILDKNKSDGLTKAIVILQAGWMVVQSISRLGYHLPVTLLEVNTMGHVICAMFIYVLWWKKPREVTEPTILKESWVPAICAYMIMSSDLDDTDGWREWTSLKPPLLPELSNLKFQLELVKPQDTTQPNVILEGINSHADKDESETFSIKARRSGFGSLGLPLETEISQSIKRQRSFKHHLDQSKLEDQTSTTRWMLALAAMEAFPHLQCRLQILQNSINGNAYTYTPQVMLSHRASNWPTKGSIPPYKGMLMGMSLWFASIAFGAIHVAAWNEYFPTMAERWLWRFSSLYLAWAGSLWLSICLLGAISRQFVAMWDKCITGKAHKAVYVCLIPICIVCGILYAFARLFLVIESVASLRQLPKSMYWTPNWPQVIPHL